MESNIKAVVRYDGSHFAGWQVQPGQKTVQGDIEAVLARIAGQPVRIHGAGRTDAGVHAMGQVFSAMLPKSVDITRLQKSISQLLSPEIRIESLEKADLGFHARKSAIGKHYVYSASFTKHPDPLCAPYSWCVPWDIGPEDVIRLAQRLVGTMDFAGFQASGSTVKSTTRTIHSISLSKGALIGPLDDDCSWRFEFHGNGFLYKMIRNVMGALVDIARGKGSEGKIDELLASKGPFIGFSAPAKGLALVQVDY